MVACLSLSGSGREVGWGGRLFEAGPGADYSAPGWALINFSCL